MRVYLPEGEEGDAPVVICSELPGNTGLSVTSAANVIAGEVIKIIAGGGHLHHRFLHEQTSRMDRTLPARDDRWVL